MRQYGQLLNNNIKSVNYNRENQRLDEFFFDTIDLSNKPDLGEVLKVVLTLGHGQADVERGFNVNKETLQHNQKENSLVARRLIKDHLRTNNIQPYTVDVTSELIRSVKAARQRYQLHLNEQEQQKTHTEHTREKNRLSSDIKDVTQKCVDMRTLAVVLDLKSVKLFRKAERKK